MSKSAPTIRTCSAFLRSRFVWPVLFGLLPGCMVVDIGVTNPVRGLRTVAVVPFFNQSDERAVDGRLLASLYASELQKTPGVEVIPVGVVETTMRRYGLANLSGPRDAAQLAILLNADAVVVGTVTEYSPYYPPRLGLSVAWYSPYGLQFDPGVPIDPKARDRIHDELKARRKAKYDRRKEQIIKRVEGRLDRFFLSEPGAGPGGGSQNETCPPDQQLPELAPPKPVIPVVPDEDPAKPPEEADRPAAPAPPSEDDARFVSPIIIRGQSPAELRRFVVQPRPNSATRNRASVVHARAVHPAASDLSPVEIRPLMSYTKVFDASDGETTAAFRDYLEWRDDDRLADWTARLQWSDHFPRFVMRMMIVEMFQLHGGEGRRRVVLKFRKHR